MTNTITWKFYKGNYESPGSYTLIDNVQTIDMSFGRMAITDQLSSNRFRVTGRRPDLLPSLAIGDRMSVVADYGGAPNDNVIQFVIADYKVNYGITSAMDTWEIVGEDAAAKLGRAAISLTFGGGQVRNAMSAVCSAAGVGYTESVLDQNPQTVSSKTVTNSSALAEMQLLYNSVTPSGGNTVGSWNANDFIIGPTGITVADPAVYTITLTDSGTPTDWKTAVYSDLEFAGIAENYATKVVVEADGMSTVTVGTGDRSYVMETLNNDATQLADVAYTMAGLLSGYVTVPLVVSYKASQQPAVTKPLMLPGTFQRWGYGSTYCDIVFRGTTYNAFVLGASVSATPEDTRVSWRLAAASWVSAFTLNSSTLGVLDQNRLGR